MKKILIAIAFSVAAMSALAQETKPTLVSVNAKGDDVRSVIHDMFKQAGKNFVLNPGVRFVLYLSLDNVKFESALDLICKNANLKFEQKDGIYMITQIPPKVEPKPIVEEKPIVKTEPPKQVATPATIKPKGTLPTTVLNKIVTTRLQKKEIREVIAMLAQQTGVTIQIAPDVPAYKLDAFLLKTSLKFALDEITTATGLKYEFTNELSIAIKKDPTKGN